MAEIKQKYYSIAHVAELMDLSKAAVLQMCHIPRQKFAFQPTGTRGKWLIDLEEFEEFIKKGDKR